MAVQPIRRAAPAPKKKKGLLDVLKPAASLASVGAAISTGGLTGLAGGLAAPQAIKDTVDLFKGEEKGPAPPTTQLETQGAAGRRVSTFQEDPNSIIRQGLNSIANLPEPLRMEAGPVLVNAFMQQQGGRRGGSTT